MVTSRVLDALSANKSWLLNGLVVAALALALAACQSAPKTNPNVVAKLKADSAQQFAANAMAVKAASPAEQAVLAALTGKYLAGFNSNNAGQVESVLAPTFQARLATGKGKALISSRAAYVKSLGWRVRDQQVDVAVKSVKVGGDGKTAAVLALVTYRSKNFAPRFLETLVFSESGSGWTLAQQAQVPLHPSVAELHSAKLYLTRPFWDKKYKSFAAYFAAKAGANGPDAVIGELQSKIIPPKGKQSHVVAVFREPPQAGSKITVSTTFQVGQAYEFQTPYPVTQSHSYFVAESIAYGEPRADTIDLAVMVNGTTVGKASLKQ